ncbi:hypothetical protein LTR84_009555 [Exophiala bonariae]|uniref:SMP-30/Gluconolactonase/LRE-like region domain-containing protein n=1 Tax=Exophiala bonariae TaxID=1690606 RepID=A0AAV9MUC8_9EURO|nr:hypothetical protein LTR84_009555 [Exophiala bonariae]
MAHYPEHIVGKAAQRPWKSIATFPVGTFLENLAVRANGSLLVASMLAGEIYFLDPHATDVQSTICRLHQFVPENVAQDNPEPGAWGGGMMCAAIVEDTRTEDVFYALSGIHGQAGSWGVYKLDLRFFDSDGTTKVQKHATVPWALWLNGAAFIPGTSKLVMAESLGGRLSSLDVDTGDVEIWLDNNLLDKLTDRAEWPAANGLKFNGENVYVTNSDRGLLLRARFDGITGKCIGDKVTVMAEGCAGDDLAFDIEGNVYVATNPNQTVLKFFGVRAPGAERVEDRFIVAGGFECTETAGPTAVAFGRTSGDEQSLYVVTTGGLLAPIGEAPGPARVLRVDVGVKGAPLLFP